MFAPLPPSSRVACLRVPATARAIVFPTAVLPGWMRAVAEALPLTYAMRAVRGALLANAGLADLTPDLLALAAFALALPIGGYALFYLTERRSRRTGDLGQY